MDLHEKKTTDETGNEIKPTKIRNLADWQRLKLEKLMKNPDKPVIIPERPKSKNTPSVPDFVRNVMGSSAGAGSGEFHVYRHLRRKEYARQKFIQEKSEKEKRDDEYRDKIEKNRLEAEQRTAKKRNKRLKKKQKDKIKQKKQRVTEQVTSDDISDSEDGESDDQCDEKNAPVCNKNNDEDI